MILSRRLTSKSQITIPKMVREALDAGPGDVLAFKVEDARVILTKAPVLDLADVSRLESSLGDEWLSAEDDAAFDDL